jgi:hypothetical protein
MFREVASGVMINLEQPRDGVILNSPIVQANGRSFSLLEKSVTDYKGEVSFDYLNEVLGKVALDGGLHGEPKTLVAITKNESIVYARVDYWNKNGAGGSRIANISGYGGGNIWPNLDVFLTNLTLSHDSGTIVPILIVDPSIRIKPYGQNIVDDSVERLDNNPYKGLEAFVGKEYDGSLGIAELEKFKGFMFGNKSFSYVYGVTHRGNDLGVTGFITKLPKIGDKYETSDSDWEIQAIDHNKFDDDFTGKDSKFAEKKFRQYLKLRLKHITYHPPLPPREQSLKIVENDKLFWTRVASLCNFDLKEIDPLYTDKQPLTPWYEATHRKTGKNVILGTRWRVYSVHDKHIPKGEPEEVYKYLSEIAKK